MNKYLQKIASELFAHTTTDNGLQRILNSGSIKSVSHVANEDPDTEVNIEPLPIPLFRSSLPASQAVDRLDALGKSPDKIFLTRGGYLPNYGENVVVKHLSHPVERVSVNTIPEEYTTRRMLSARSNATIYVPNSRLESYRQSNPEYVFDSLDNIPIKRYGFMDRSLSYPGKLMKVLGLNKEASLPISPRSISRNAFVAGSEGLGIDLGDGSDVDVFVPYLRYGSYQRAISRAKEMYPDLQERSSTANKQNKTTLSGTLDGKDVDLVFGHGEKAISFKDAYLDAKASLTDDQREEIKRQKAKLKYSWLFPETRYRRYKNTLAEELGLKQHYF